MAILKYLRESKDKALLSLCIVEGEEKLFYTVTKSAYSQIGSPKSGDEITDEDLCALEYENRLYQAEKKALSILAYADNNRRSLMQKLIRAGFDRDTSNQVCEKMVSLGYINEERQIERLILIEANSKLRGPGKIIPYLVSKGYNYADVRSIFRHLCEIGEVDLGENANRLLEKKNPNGDPEEGKKILFKNGYKL